MNFNAKAVVDALAQSGAPFEDRGYLLSVAFARAIAYKFPLPAEACEDPYLFFNSTYTGELEILLGAINERQIINIDEVTDLARRIWIFRYRVAFDALNKTTRDFLDAALKVGSREIPPKASEVMIKYGENQDLIDSLTRSIWSSLVEGTQ